MCRQCIPGFFFSAYVKEPWDEASTIGAIDYTCYCQLYRLVSLLFTPVQQFHPTCLCNFYTCSTLYLLIFFGGGDFFYGSLICVVGGMHHKIILLSNWRCHNWTMASKHSIAAPECTDSNVYGVMCVFCEATCRLWSISQCQFIYASVLLTPFIIVDCSATWKWFSCSCLSVYLQHVYGSYCLHAWYIYCCLLLS